MKKQLLIIISLLTFVISQAQTSGMWSSINENQYKGIPKVNRSSFPNEYKLFSLNINVLKNRLISAKNRNDSRGISNTIIELPNAEGNLEHYTVYEMPIMEPALAAQFPMIKSYAAQGIEDPTAVARFSVTQLGLHSMTLSGGKSTVFIDPYTEDRQTYIVYNKASLTKPLNDFECLTKSGVNLPSLTNDRNSNPNQSLNTDDKKLRTYRLAQSCTAEYGNLFIGTATTDAAKKSNIQAQMAITMTRVNGVYEKDLSITMIFIAANASLIYYGAVGSDPWSGEYNIQTGLTIDANVGFSSYDIGHNFNTSGGGNAGCIGCVAGPNTDPASGDHKGTGMTGRSNPTGDPFDIDYVAHEMGHQFGGFHVQSSSGCRSGSGLTEVEPGSGSSIMGYAGICATNVQANSDAYFGYVNIRDISDNVQFGISSNIPASQVSNFLNNPPTANAGADYVIPKSTAFVLEGAGSDPDGNAITYNWEENDPGDPATTAAPVATRAVGPMFRSKMATTSPNRFMPPMANILTGATSTTMEVCPSVGRDLNFSLTVRDNVATGGQTASDLMKVTVNGTAGPFLVNIPNTNVSWAGGTNQTVTWAVAGTNINGINAKFVDIYLSQNAGTSFPILLASKVPNDGSETVTIPNTAGTTNRIMVRGYNNIFLDVSNTNFTTTAAATATFGVAFNGVAGQQNKSICQSISTITYPIAYTAIAGFAGTTTFAASGVPANTTVSFSPTSMTASGVVTMTVNTTATTTVGLANIIVTATSGAISKTAPFYLEVLSSNFLGASLTTPANNAVAQNTALNLTWAADTNATSYDVQLASDLAFTTIIASGTTTATSFPVSGLTQGTNYYWRVLPKNVACSGVYGAAFKFETGIITCQPSVNSTNIPLTVVSTGPNTINSTLNIPSGGTISDVNVTMNMTHTYVGDVTATLLSPAGTQIQLFFEPCSGSDDVIATFDDAGATAICGSTPALSGTIKPSQLLSTLNGQSSTGTWTLRIADGYNGDGGSLNSWSLDICTILSVALSNPEFELNDLNLYPNPNKGDFTIRFTSISTNDIKINVHDMRGRQVYEKSFSNTGTFNQNINLNKVEAGIYLVTITDGAKKTVKRIIVE
jgi:subtilisin-like proprotein convertase family protein